jgi:CO/xanthine dehydrogenase Mo-binding subunit
MPEFDVVGKHLAAVSSQAIVTGKAVYCPDIELPNMLVGKLLYSPHASARILRLDVTQARAIPGVVAVLTAGDIPGENSYLYWYPDQPLLVTDQVRYQGDAVAAVAAESDEIAQAALAAIEVDYEPLMGIFDPEEAMQPGAVQVWPDKSNVQSHYVDQWGDIKLGFSQADVIVDNTYSTHYEEHAMLETESAVAYLEPDGTVVVYASAQAPHRDRMQIARALGLPEAMVREITPHIGGAFGAKDEANIQIHAALLAYATGQPVRIVRTREESIQTHVKRHPAKIRYRTGATKDGKLTAVHMIAVGDTGPYVNAGEEVMMVMANYGVSPYYVPNARSEAYTVLTNNPICGAFRGFGVPQVTFAFERQMDELARRLEIDPLEIRLLNGLQTGHRFQPKAIVRQGDGMQACLEKAAHLSSWQERENLTRQPVPHLRRGWGIAASFHKSGFGCDVTDHASAAVNMAPDGSVLVRTGAADMGQGAHTVIAQFVAEQLGVIPSQVKVYKPDTTLAGDAGASVASRATLFSGNAVIRAAEPIRKVLLDLAAEETGADQDLISLGDGFVHVEGERVNLAISHLAAKAYEMNLPMQASGFYAMEYPHVELPDGSHGYEQLASFGAHVAQVLVDIETGLVEVEQIVAVHDVGQVVNPGGLRGQIEGAVSMAFGFTFMEELLVKGGKTLNNSLESYLIPTSFDTPDIKIDVVELHDPEAPLGAKGVGEPPINITPAAIANAVSDAIQMPVNQLPISPERILDRMQTGSEGGTDAS